jgi:glycosyltransferase involved in cell wall biosynthesis
MSPAVSVIVPCFNYGRFLRECLDSVLGQVIDGDLEVLVIDDASTDDSAEIVRSFADRRLRLIRHPTNFGHVASLNHGLCEARGQFIARIDADDRYRPGFFSRALETFAGHPDAGAVYGEVALIDDDGRITAEAAGNPGMSGDVFANLLLKNFIGSAALIARREAWAVARPIPREVGFEDDWYYTLCMARHFRFEYLGEVIADYRVHPSNHHSRVMADGSEEFATRWILKRMLSDPPDGAPPDLARRVYAAHLAILGDKYFGNRMYPDARRCYLQCIGNEPAMLLDSSLFRHLLGTVVGEARYEQYKATAFALMRRMGWSRP